MGDWKAGSEEPKSGSEASSYTVKSRKNKKKKKSKKKRRSEEDDDMIYLYMSFDEKWPSPEKAQRSQVKDDEVVESRRRSRSASVIRAAADAGEEKATTQGNTAHDSPARSKGKAKGKKSYLSLKLDIIKTYQMFGVQI